MVTTLGERNKQHLWVTCTQCNDGREVMVFTDSHPIQLTETQEVCELFGGKRIIDLATQRVLEEQKRYRKDVIYGVTETGEK